MDESLNVVNATQEPTVEAQTAEPEKATAPETAPEQAKRTETAEPSQDKPKQTQEENAKFAEIRRKMQSEAAQKVAEAEQKARDKAVAEMAERMGWTANGRKVSTWDDFEALKAEADFIEKGYDPKAVKDLIEKNPTVMKANKVLEEIAQKEKKTAEFRQFFEAFQQDAGRAFDAKTDSAVFAEVKAIADGENKTLTDAFVKIQNKTLAAKVKELEARLKAAETNKKNAESSPGSVSGGDTSATSDYITPESFEANRKNADWVRRNYDKILKSRPKWIG